MKCWTVDPLPNSWKYKTTIDIDKTIKASLTGLKGPRGSFLLHYRWLFIGAFADSKISYVTKSICRCKRVSGALACARNILFHKGKLCGNAEWDHWLNAAKLIFWGMQSLSHVILIFVAPVQTCRTCNCVCALSIWSFFNIQHLCSTQLLFLQIPWTAYHWNKYYNTDFPLLSDCWLHTPLVLFIVLCKICSFLQCC